ncbi:MAG: atoC [Myxococcales bacterium]|nr:atoC [Myxococcales bacterium]
MAAVPEAVTKRRILIVEDDPDVRRTLERCLVREGCEVTSAVDGKEAAEKIDRARPEMIITDLEMPRAGGREVVALAVQRRVPVVVLTGHGSVQTAVELMRAGAANFLTKPFTPETLRSLLSDTFGRTKPGDVVGREESFQDVLDIVTAVAETDATILITGESGTGKEVVARAIHRASKRAKGPFVAVNCGAIPEALLESELFGHARGAFTGATHARAGRFQLAEGGTLFLDEIGDMPLAFQVKLLRVMQERQFEVLGEGTTRSADVRVIAATHRDLPTMVKAGTFREDFYYRLNVVDVKLPPLRDRAGDIPLLAEHFTAVANARHQTHVTGVAPSLMEKLQRYRWPGNVRELGNVIERMVIFQKRGLLEHAGLPPTIESYAGDATVEEVATGGSAAVGGAAPVAGDGAADGGAAGDGGSAPALPPEGLDLRATVAQLEETLIEQALARTGGNRNAAAQLLGLNRTTLVEKLKRTKKPV